MPLGMAGVMVPGEPGRGGSGIAGGGEGSVVPAGGAGCIDLRLLATELEELDRARAKAAASGESDSRLNPATEVTERRLISVSCDYDTISMLRLWYRNCHKPRARIS